MEKEITIVCIQPLLSFFLICHRRRHVPSISQSYLEMLQTKSQLPNSHNFPLSLLSIVPLLLLTPIQSHLQLIANKPPIVLPISALPVPLPSKGQTLKVISYIPVLHPATHQMPQNIPNLSNTALLETEVVMLLLFTFNCYILLHCQ